MLHNPELPFIQPRLRCALSRFMNSAILPPSRSTRSKIPGRPARAGAYRRCRYRRRLLRRPADSRRLPDPARTALHPGQFAFRHVESVGEGVEHLEPGTPVAAFALHGGMAEQVLLPAASCAPLPPGLDLESAANFFISWATSLYGLREIGAVSLARPCWCWVRRGVPARPRSSAPRRWARESIAALHRGQARTLSRSRRR